MTKTVSDRSIVPTGSSAGTSGVESRSFGSRGFGTSRIKTNKCYDNRAAVLLVQDEGTLAIRMRHVDLFT
jgi:hypothetical protein